MLLFLFYNKGNCERKKVLFLVAGPLRGGGRLNGCANKEKRTFFYVRKKGPMATKPKGLSGRDTTKITFFAASLM